MSTSRNAVWDPTAGPRGRWKSAQDMGGGGGGGPGGSVTVTESALPTGASTSALQTAANTAFGAQADAAASSDGGTFSYIALFKRLLAKLTGGTASVVTAVASSTTSGLLVAASATASRKGLVVVNDSTAVLYLKFASTAASATDYSVKLEAGGYLVLSRDDYQGAISGIWAAANGFARVTAVT